MSPDKHKRKKRPTLKLGSWNVRTMTTGMDPENINDARKTAIINNELLCLKVDIAALQETRLAGQGSIKEKNLLSSGLVSLLKNVKNMVLVLLSRIHSYNM